LDATRSKASGNASFPMPIEPDTEFRGGLEVVSYELDIWGRIRRANEAALAELAADTAVMHGVRSSLAANVAQVYFQTLALDKQLALLSRLHATRSDNEQLQKLRLDSGLISPYDYEQARSETAAVAAQLPGLRESRRQALTALAVLRGATPEVMFTAWASPQDLAEFSLPDAPAVPMDLPSDMLARRPDVIAAEQRLIAANARIGVAKADYFPRLSLGGFFGGLSTSFSTLDADSSRNWNAAVAASVPLTNLREIGTRVDSASAATEAAAASYAGTVQLAFQEALNAMGAVESTLEVRTAQQQRVAALENAYRISTARYDVGRIGYLELLDVERQLRQIEQQQVEAQLAQLQATVDLYRALGGGW
ncbi:MAG: efflux transporter outer membrane subunit, partial [Woeseia sp.]